MIFKGVIKEDEPTVLVDYLAQKTKLSKAQIKKIAINGAVWFKKGNKGKNIRIRRAKFQMRAGDGVELYFDEKIEFQDTSACIPLWECKKWGIWYKPAGVLSQGTMYGDASSLIRHIEKIKTNAYIVHRLDRETVGLMAIAYTQKTAMQLTNQWKGRNVKKFYQAEVLGDVIESLGEEGIIDSPIDEKSALTKFKVISTTNKTSQIEVEITTGRMHQIRKHFEMVGHPVMGDPKYGTRNKNKDGLKLVAHKLGIKDPSTNELVEVELPQELKLF